MSDGRELAAPLLSTKQLGDDKRGKRRWRDFLYKSLPM